MTTDKTLKMTKLKTLKELKIYLVKGNKGFVFKDFNTNLSLKVPEVKFEKNILLIIEEHNKLSDEKWILMRILK